LSGKRSRPVTLSEAKENWASRYCSYALGVPEEELPPGIKVGTKDEVGTCAWYMSEKRKLLGELIERVTLDELRRITEMVRKKWEKIEKKAKEIREKA